APHVLRGLRVAQDGADALVDEIAVVIPRDDFPVAQPLSLHRGAEVVLEEVAFVLGAVDARLPRLCRHGLVLYADAPDGNAFPLIRLDELRVVPGPRRCELRRQLSAV